MKKKELHSAFLLSTIKESLNDIVAEDDIEIDSLIRTLTSFNIFYNETNKSKSSSLIDVYTNCSICNEFINILLIFKYYYYKY